MLIDVDWCWFKSFKHFKHSTIVMISVDLQFKGLNI